MRWDWSRDWRMECWAYNHPWDIPGQIAMAMVFGVMNGLDLGPVLVWLYTMNFALV